MKPGRLCRSLLQRLAPLGLLALLAGLGCGATRNWSATLPAADVDAARAADRTAALSVEVEGRAPLEDVEVASAAGSDGTEQRYSPPVSLARAAHELPAGPVRIVLVQRDLSSTTQVIAPVVAATGGLVTAVGLFLIGSAGVVSGPSNEVPWLVPAGAVTCLAGVGIAAIGGLIALGSYLVFRSGGGDLGAARLRTR